MDNEYIIAYVVGSLFGFVGLILLIIDCKKKPRAAAPLAVEGDGTDPGEEVVQWSTRFSESTVKCMHTAVFVMLWISATSMVIVGYTPGWAAYVESTAIQSSSQSSVYQNARSASVSVGPVRAVIATSCASQDTDTASSWQCADATDKAANTCSEATKYWVTDYMEPYNDDSCDDDDSTSSDDSTSTTTTTYYSTYYSEYGYSTSYSTSTTTTTYSTTYSTTTAGQCCYAEPCGVDDTEQLLVPDSSSCAALSLVSPQYYVAIAGVSAFGAFVAFFNTRRSQRPPTQRMAFIMTILLTDMTAFSAISVNQWQGVLAAAGGDWAGGGGYNFCIVLVVLSCIQLVLWLLTYPPGFAIAYHRMLQDCGCEKKPKNDPNSTVMMVAQAGGMSERQAQQAVKVVAAVQKVQSGAEGLASAAGSMSDLEGAVSAGSSEGPDMSSVEGVEETYGNLKDMKDSAKDTKESLEAARDDFRGAADELKGAQLFQANPLLNATGATKGSGAATPTTSITELEAQKQAAI